MFRTVRKAPLMLTEENDGEIEVYYFEKYCSKVE